MKKSSFFKTEAKWSAAINYLPPALGLLAALAASVVGWLGAG
jgi:hypothetical protein